LHFNFLVHHYYSDLLQNKSNQNNKIKQLHHSVSSRTVSVDVSCVSLTSLMTLDALLHQPVPFVLEQLLRRTWKRPIKQAVLLVDFKDMV
jgi:hypothetical protein